jgi:hypothetical protein
MKWGGSKPQDYMWRKGMFPSAFLFSFLLFLYRPLLFPFVARCNTQVLQEVCAHENYSQGIVTVNSQLLLNSTFHVNKERWKIDLFNQKIQTFCKTNGYLSRVRDKKPFGKWRKLIKSISVIENHMLYLETAIIKNLRIISSASVLELDATALHENAMSVCVRACVCVCVHSAGF